VALQNLLRIFESVCYFRHLQLFGLRADGQACLEWQREQMLDRADLIHRIAEIVGQSIPAQSLSTPDAENMDLYDVGLTSMAMVKLMLAIEVEFDLSIPDSDLHPDNFRSINAIEKLVIRLQSDHTR
jgi:acyl carrier protein